MKAAIRTIAAFLAAAALFIALIAGLNHYTQAQLDGWMAQHGANGIAHARINWAELPSGPFFSELQIINLDLRGKIDREGNFSVAGQTPAALYSLVAAETDSLTLDGGHIRLDTPAGAIRLSFTGRMTKQADGSRKIEAELKSDDDPMAFDTRWGGSFSANGRWQISIDISAAKLATPHIAVSRANGWLFLAQQNGGAPALSGQINAGLARLGDTSTLTDISLILQGTLDARRTVITGLASGNAAMPAALDIEQTPGGVRIHASVAAPDIVSLSDFLRRLRADLQEATPRSFLLTSLLLTPGNLDRIACEAQKMQYDSLEMEVDGVPGDLTGKISVRKGGRETGVIGMNRPSLDQRAALS